MTDTPDPAASILIDNAAFLAIDMLYVDTEILIEVTPKFVEIWDEDKDRNAFQLFIDFDKETVEYKPYD